MRFAAVPQDPNDRELVPHPHAPPSPLFLCGSACDLADLKGQQLDISAWHRHDAGGDESGPVISASTYFSRTIIVPPGVRSEVCSASGPDRCLLSPVDRDRLV